MASAPDALWRQKAETHVHRRTANRLSTTKLSSHTPEWNTELYAHSPYAIANTNSRAYLYAYMHIILVIKSKHSIIAKHKQYIRTNTTKLPEAWLATGGPKLLCMQLQFDIMRLHTCLVL